MIGKIVVETRPVLIIGAGPTGMTAAIELKRLGVPVRIIDKVVEAPTTSRAVGVQARTLELLEQRGLVAPLLSKGNPAHAASVYGGGKRVFQLAFDHIDSDYRYLLFVSQCETETLLRSRLEELGVEIERGVELVAFAQPESRSHPGGSDGVVAILRLISGGSEHVEAAFLIAAEGAHSVVRSTLGLQFQGRSHPEDYALGDLLVDGDLPPEDFYIFSSEHGFMGMFPMGGSRFRLIASNPISEPSRDTEPTLNELQRIYDGRSPIPARFHDMTWSSWFRINSRMVERLRQGRILLGGDAAHIHSPAGAQGMNTGIQDMIDLGWKLALVYHGHAHDSLLDTYEEDRLPVIRNVLTKTEGLTGAIGNTNALFRSAFDLVAPLLVGTEFVQRESTTRMSQVGLNYRTSPLSRTVSKVGSLRAGDRIPNVTVTAVNRPGSADADPRPARLFELLDPSSFTLLYANVPDAPAMHEEIGRALVGWKAIMPGHQLGAPGSQADKEVYRTLFGEATSVTLVRPDGYIGFVGGRDDIAALADYCQHWLAPVALPGQTVPA